MSLCVCGSSKVLAHYTCPILYKCETCGARWSGPPIPVLTAEQAQRKRPALYGLAVCDCCTHAPHPNGPCEFCESSM